MKVCTFEGCDRECHAKGYCGMHYHRLVRYGDVNVVKKPAFVSDVCTLDGCNKKHYAKGMCQYHWRKEYVKSPEVKASISVQNKKYRANNLDKIKAKEKPRKKEYGKIYRAKNSERLNAKTREWFKANPDYHAKWREENRHLHNGKELRRRARKLNNGIFDIKPSEMKRLYDSPCINCGSFDRIEADHIVPISKGGRHSIGNLQPLCKKCNISKGNKFMFQWKQSIKVSGSNR